MDERLRRLLAAIAGLIAAGGLQGDPQVSAPGANDLPGVGVVTHSLNQASVDRLTDLGVGHVRYTLYWSNWGRADYRASFRRDIDRAVRAGLVPLVVVHQQPSGGYANRERVYRDFAEFMEARAREFPQVRAWQLWNEMDVGFTDVFGAGRSDVSLRQRGRNYADMLHLTYPAIKRGNPQAVVVTGGLASGPRDGFLQGIYDRNGPFDVVGLHTYGFPVARPFQVRGEEVRRVMRSNGDNRPIWVTEFGTSRRVIPPDWNVTRADIDRYHLEAWRDSFTFNDRAHLYGRVYGHALQQEGDEGVDLIRRDGSPRPAYTWLREWTRQRAR